MTVNVRVRTVDWEKLIIMLLFRHFFSFLMQCGLRLEGMSVFKEVVSDLDVSQ